MTNQHNTRNYWMEKAREENAQRVRALVARNRKKGQKSGPPGKHESFAPRMPFFRAGLLWVLAISGLVAVFANSKGMLTLFQGLALVAGVCIAYLFIKITRPLWGTKPLEAFDDDDPQRYDEAQRQSIADEYEKQLAEARASGAFDKWESKE